MRGKVATFYLKETEGCTNGCCNEIEVRSTEKGKLVTTLCSEGFETTFYGNFGSVVKLSTEKPKRSHVVELVVVINWNNTRVILTHNGNWAGSMSFTLFRRKFRVAPESNMKLYAWLGYATKKDQTKVRKAA